MANPIKPQLEADLQKAKEEGKLRSERIREIVKSSVSEAVSEVKEGSSEIRSIVRDAVSTVIETLKERGGEVKEEEVTASIEGAIEGITSTRRRTIAKAEAEVKQLQAQIDTDEKELQAQIDDALVDIEQTSNGTPDRVKAAVESAINSFKDSEEADLMRRRYAQLQAQLAILKANLSARYGEQYEDVKKYLDDAKSWHERTKPQAEAAAEKVKQKQNEFEEKLGEAGAALARRERKVKQLLRELWHSVTEVSDEK